MSESKTEKNIEEKIIKDDNPKRATFGIEYPKKDAKEVLISKVNYNDLVSNHNEIKSKRIVFLLYKGI